MKKGFTLVEMAMVLIVVGLLMGGGFQMMKVMQEKARSTEAKQTLEAAKEAVIAFAINNNRLPTAAVDFPSMNLVGAGNTPIFYNSDAALQANLCGTITTPLNTTDANGVNTPNIAFVLAVNGENMQAQTTRTGTNITFPQWNTVTLGLPYDDFHIQVTLAELQSLAGCQQLRIINPQLPVGDVNASYSARIISEGGDGVNYNYTFAPNSIGGYTFPADGNISHTWTTSISPTPINITVSSGTNPPSTRRYVLQIN